MDRESTRRGARPPRRVRLGEQDLELMWFLAEHRMALPDHAAALLGTSAAAARARLAKLVDAGYVRCADVFRHHPAMYLIEREGLKALGSRFARPRLDLRTYEHDAGVAWLWLAARDGTFGPLSEIVGERRLRSHDATRDRGVEPLAVKLGGAGPRGRERLHYPDLLLRTADGRRIALELELSAKGPARLEKILAGYASDPRIDGVVYLVQSAAVARSVQAAARRLRMSSLLHIQRVRSTVTSPAAASAPDVARAVPGRTRRRSEAARRGSEAAR